MWAMADREGFEPPIPLRVCRISSAVLSTAQPPVRGGDQILSPRPDGKSHGTRPGAPRIGSRSWIRTTIGASKVRRPAVRRSGVATDMGGQSRVGVAATLSAPNKNNMGGQSRVGVAATLSAPNKNNMGGQSRVGVAATLSAPNKNNMGGQSRVGVAATLSAGHAAGEAGLVWRVHMLRASMPQAFILRPRACGFRNAPLSSRRDAARSHPASRSCPARIRTAR